MPENVRATQSSEIGFTVEIWMKKMRVREERLNKHVKEKKKEKKLSGESGRSRESPKWLSRETFFFLNVLFNFANFILFQISNYFSFLHKFWY